MKPAGFGGLLLFTLLLVSYRSARYGCRDGPVWGRKISRDEECMADERVRRRKRRDVRCHRTIAGRVDAKRSEIDGDLAALQRRRRVRRTRGLVADGDVVSSRWQAVCGQHHLGPALILRNEIDAADLLTRRIKDRCIIMEDR